MRRYWNEEKMWSPSKDCIEHTGEDKRTKNDKLEAPLESSWATPGKNIDGKGVGRLHMNKMDTRLRNLSPWRKREGGREKQRQAWRRMKQTPLRRNDNRSWECWSDRIHLKRITPVGKDWHDNLDCREGLVSHRNMRTPFGKGMESTFDFEATRIPQIKQNKGFGLQNKPETNIW